MALSRPQLTDAQIEHGWRVVVISKELSHILRHADDRLGIPFRADGYAPLDDVLSKCSFNFWQDTPREVIDYVVRRNSKKRFQLKAEGSRTFIRAVQGHSISIVNDRALWGTPIRGISPRHCLVHGTFYPLISSILREGLLPGGTRGADHRRHIHFLTCRPGRHPIQHLRHGCDIVIYVDIAGQ